MQRFSLSKATRPGKGGAEMETQVLAGKGKALTDDLRRAR